MRNNNQTKCSKLTALLLALALLCALLAGCNSSKDDIRSQPDSDQSDSAEDSSQGDLALADMPEFRVALELQNGFRPDFQSITNQVASLKNFNVVVEILPDTEPERSNAITQIRTEMMAGKGPDVFICDCYFGNMLDTYEHTLFQFPEKAMENRLFLPLDEYIENAQYMEWDKLLPVVMDAGRNNEGQQILPIAYMFKVGGVLADVYTPELPADHKAMLDSGDKVLELESIPWTDSELYQFGQPADVLNEELTFTEDELLDLAMEIRDGYKKLRDGYFDDYYVGGAGPENGYNLFRVNMGEDVFHITDGVTAQNTDINLVPDLNRDGGITAEIRAYAAVNRNTKYPQEAFDLLDRLLSQRVMQTETFYYLINYGGVVTNVEVGTAKEPYMLLNANWSMNDYNYQQFMDMNEKINAVKFFSPLDREASFQLGEVCRKEGVTDEEIQRAVHSSYTTMKMMLAES